jgi:hypothetical protein
VSPSRDVMIVGEALSLGSPSIFLELNVKRPLVGLNVTCAVAPSTFTSKSPSIGSFIIACFPVTPWSGVPFREISGRTVLK